MEISSSVLFLGLYFLVCPWLYQASVSYMMMKLSIEIESYNQQFLL